MKIKTLIFYFLYLAIFFYLEILLISILFFQDSKNTYLEVFIDHNLKNQSKLSLIVKFTYNNFKITIFNFKSLETNNPDNQAPMKQRPFNDTYIGRTAKAYSMGA